MISAVVLAKNEEKNITACLESLGWCDEIVVIDDNSTDKTVELAKKKGAKIFSRDMNGNFATQRNFGISKARGDWVLFVDADERISSPLWYEIMAETNEANNDIAGYYINRQDTMWGKVLKYGETGTIRLLRLARRNAGQWEGKVHEVWKVRGKVSHLKNGLDHFPHRTVEEFLREINFYTDIRAAELYEKKVKAYWWSPILYPKAKFVLNYFLRRGFLDGLPGFVFAMLMSLHSFMVRAKLWLLWQKNPHDKV
jgi:glycosyltransferase involved in cell wall biosynthesis